MSNNFSYKEISPKLRDLWQASYPEDHKWQHNLEADTVHSILDKTASKFPDNVAIDFFNNKYTYNFVNDEVNKLAVALVNAGLQKNDKVGIYLPNCPHFIFAYYAVLKAGGVVVNCSPLYSESELDFQLTDSEAKFIFTLNLGILYPKAESLLKKSQKEDGLLKKLIVCEMAKTLPFPKNFLFNIFKKKEVANINENNPAIFKYDDFKKEFFCFDVNLPDVSVDNTAVIQYTGGTTGRPKGAELTHKNLHINTHQSKLWTTDINDGNGTMLIVLPLFHVFAMTTAMNLGVASACKMILHPRFDIKQVLTDIQKKKVTSMLGVPTIFNAISNYPDTPDYNLKSLRMCISGGGPLPIEVKRKFEDITGCNLVEGYGLTETSPVACCNPIDGLNKEGSIGLPLADTEILIEDMEERGRFLDIEGIGELCIKGSQVMKGYYKKDEANKEIFHTLENGEVILRTGDVAKIDHEGYIFIVDRLKEMIISGGFKIYPRHVEEIIYEHKDVLECAVVGVDDDYSGQLVKAFIVFQESFDEDKKLADLKEFLKHKLAKHEYPKEFEVRDILPKTPIGKILKKELK